MAYQQGGTIAYGDFNTTLVGPNPSTTSGQLNAFWGIGSGDAGYGQSFTQSATQGGSVTAAQWGTLMTTFNNASKHQSGTSSPSPALLTPVQAQDTITFMSALGSGLTTMYNNRLNSAFGVGTLTQSSGFAFNATSASNPAALTQTATRTVTFSGGADAARYFFNCGGKLNFVTSSVVNNGGGNRSGDLVTLINGVGSINSFAAHSNAGNSGGTGSGTTFTRTTNATTIGYYELTTTEQPLVKVTSTNYPYSGDYVQVTVKSNGTQGSNSDKGTVLTFTLYTYLTNLKDSYGDKSFNVTWNHRIDVQYPETTNLSASWGSVTVA